MSIGEMTTFASIFLSPVGGFLSLFFKPQYLVVQIGLLYYLVSRNWEQNLFVFQFLRKGKPGCSHKNQWGNEIISYG